jgi:uncharacterized membrane protein
MDVFTFIKEWINNNPGKATGAILGFVTGILLLTFGVVQTLLIILLVIIGIILGKFRDDKISIINQVKSLFKRGE